MNDNCWRMVVISSEEESVTVARVARTNAEPGDEHFFLKGTFPVGSRINVIEPSVSDDNVLDADLIVYEPDYLVDVTSIARCFESYADDAVVSLLSKLDATEDSPAILLGAFASQLLDEAIYDRDETTLEYSDSVRRFFRSNALSLAACTDFSPGWHDEARSQRLNLRRIMASIDRDKALVEPSFVCEMLGLQGRMDLLQSDGMLLVEQKSGKWNLERGHRISHYVQMLLYLAVMKFNFRLSAQQVSAYLLYSKYPDGLLREAESPALLCRAMQIRNDIVRLELDLTDFSGVRHHIGTLRVDDLNRKACHPNLWIPYVRPRLQSILQPIQEADNLSLAYFYRFFAFLEREQALHKVGPSILNRNSSDEKWLHAHPGKEYGLSGMWNLTPSEKRQSGNLLDNMTIRHLSENDQGDVEEITFSLSQELSDVLPNFRIGDVVALYRYLRRTAPDVCKTIEHRATIVDLSQTSVSVRLRSPQRNRNVFKPSSRSSYLWALEHDFMGATFGVLYQGLHALLSADADRRSLLLGERPPRIDCQLRLCGDYGDFNSLVLKSKCARDFFLLVGPPGTGKTSFGLVNILKEELFSDDRNAVLLLSYTNRAVDEICSKLVKENIDFIRMGNGWTTDEAYLDYLLNRRMRHQDNVRGIRDEISRVRVFVSTVSSLNANRRIFKLKSFSLAIVDEASQILEPYLVGLLSARWQCTSSPSSPNAIGRFVLIGDEKQLPAVVLQRRDESAVSEKVLLDIGIRNCRESLFERLLHRYRDREDLTYVLSRQGRMHPEVASFASLTFYDATLQPVGLPHQLESLCFRFDEESDELERMVATQRMLFVPSSGPSDTASQNPDGLLNTNLQEARLAARIAAAVFRLYALNNVTFDVSASLGIIVPYRSQIAAIRQQLALLSGDVNYAPLLSVTIDTVERFQGSERDVIIYSTTVQHQHQLDFLTDSAYTNDRDIVIDRKLNVALTRARKQFFLVGNPLVLQLNPLYARLISHMPVFN